MEKNKPLNLKLDDLQSSINIIKNASFRFINRDIAMVNSFAQMESILFRTLQPYRAREGRIIRILRGTAHISINLIEYTVKEQMIVITPTNSLIELLDISPDYDFQIIVPDNDFLPVVQNGSLMDSYCMKHGSVLALDEEEWQHTDAFFSLLWDTLQQTPFRRDVVQYMVTALLYDIRYLHDRNREAAHSCPSRREEVFQRFIALVNEHSKHQRTTAFYADKLFLTPRYLSTVIKEASGQTVMQWINQAVILEAKVLLKHSSLLVFQISDELDFPNPSFFSKFFKRMTGMTPAEYQKR